MGTTEISRHDMYHPFRGLPCMESQQQFTEVWNKYLPGAEFPIAFYYTDEPASERVRPPPCRKGQVCETRSNDSLDGSATGSS